MAERIDFAISRWQRALERKGSLGHNDDRRIVTRKSTFDERTHFVDVERTLRDEYCVGTTGDAGMPCDPARITSHDLDDEYAVMTFGRGVQTIDGFSGNRDGGVETERVVGGAQIVIDSLWYAHDRESDRGEFGRHAQGVLTPDHDKTFDTHAIHRVENQAFTIVISIRISSTGPEDRTSPGEDAANRGDVKRYRVTLHGPSPPVPKSDELVTVNLDSLAHDSSDHGVQTRAVPAAREHSYPHGWERTQNGARPEIDCDFHLTRFDSLDVCLDMAC